MTGALMLQKTLIRSDRVTWLAPKVFSVASWSTPRQGRFVFEHSWCRGSSLTLMMLRVGGVTSLNRFKWPRKSTERMISSL
ncbi:hypothetical protein FB468_1399 [Leucobacter komagatae]|uniref:Uncharacterized protein n=1 Tax=Leucobacter komagatae TaxID=55969 RepID=A0A542Y5L6_9MICO|nr:hypothetical protein FB468_1399 [Leucobacter komagatae]